ncbi:MAG: thioredoxin-disulfide reductase [Saprospiraceae bacterium]|nr:thioredoxin-disulfide reductase [Saprospiraceae bacterium]
MDENHYDVIVIGAGPAGLTAGIYLSRAKMKTLIINKGVSGGQMVLTHEVANYPGVENISGYMLSRTMARQAQSFGCKIISNATVEDLSLEGEVKSVSISGKGIFTAQSIILASGGKSRQLGVPGEKEFSGKGISYCATCDGDFFQDKEIIVVGGGNSALEEAVSLTQYASKVTIVHQFDHFQAYEHAIDEAKGNAKIDFIMSSTISQFHGDGKLNKVTIKNLETQIEMEKQIDGVFIFIGYVPRTDFLKHKVKLNQWGEILTDSDLETNVKGVYAAGDARAKKYRQITTATADGTIAALNAIAYVNEYKKANVLAF